MPDRHFYLLRHHFSFYIKFLLFCLLAPDEIRILCEKNKGNPQKIMINQRTISPLENSSENQSLPIAPISFTIISLQFRKKISPSRDLELSEKRKNILSQMRLGSVFKMRMSILNTATTEKMG